MDEFDVSLDTIIFANDTFQSVEEEFNKIKENGSNESILSPKIDTFFGRIREFLEISIEDWEKRRGALRSDISYMAELIIRCELSNYDFSKEQKANIIKKMASPISKAIKTANLNLYRTSTGGDFKFEHKLGVEYVKINYSIAILAALHKEFCSSIGGEKDKFRNIAELNRMMFDLGYAADSAIYLRDYKDIAVYATIIHNQASSYCFDLMERLKTYCLSTEGLYKNLSLIIDDKAADENVKAISKKFLKQVLSRKKDKQVLPEELGYVLSKIEDQQAINARTNGRIPEKVLSLAEEAILEFGLEKKLLTEERMRPLSQSVTIEVTSELQDSIFSESITEMEDGICKYIQNNVGYFYLPEHNSKINQVFDKVWSADKRNGESNQKKLQEIKKYFNLTHSEAIKADELFNGTVFITTTDNGKTEYDSDCKFSKLLLDSLGLSYENLEEDEESGVRISPELLLKKVRNWLIFYSLENYFETLENQDDYGFGNAKCAIDTELENVGFHKLRLVVKDVDSNFFDWYIVEVLKYYEKKWGRK